MSGAADAEGQQGAALARAGSMRWAHFLRPAPEAVGRPGTVCSSCLVRAWCGPGAGMFGSRKVNSVPEQEERDYGPGLWSSEPLGGKRENEEAVSPGAEVAIGGDPFGLSGTGAAQDGAPPEDASPDDAVSRGESSRSRDVLAGREQHPDATPSDMGGAAWVRTPIGSAPTARASAGPAILVPSRTRIRSDRRLNRLLDL